MTIETSGVTAEPQTIAGRRAMEYIQPAGDSTRSMSSAPLLPEQFSRQMARVCPQCGGQIYRMRRRPVDRVLSMFRPVWRYRCVSVNCLWVGNLPAAPSRVESPPDSPSDSPPDAPPS